MSVFKRLTNVARGKMMEIGRALDSGSAGDEPDELDPFVPPPRRNVSASLADKREMLERLRNEGLLTDEEFTEKMATLEGGSPPQPKKRRL